MTSTISMEQSIKNSFDLVKRDICNTYGHIRYLYSEVSQLRNELAELKQKLNQKNIPKIVASKTAQKTHNERCAFAQKIKAKNKIVFSNRSEALGQGFTACDCLAVV